MFGHGDQVVYGVHGICRITGTELRSVDRKKVEYYVLEPVEQPGARFYVPTQNQAAVAKLRTILSREELEQLLASVKASTDSWIPDENRRKLCYRELISSGDRARLLCMVRTLHKQKQAQLEAGRKFHLCDENFLRDAQKLLSAEFSMVLGMTTADTERYIQDSICE